MGAGGRGRRRMTTLLAIAGFLLALYAGVALFLWVAQPRLVYYPGFPTRELVRTPAEAGLDYQDVRLQADDDTALHGWYVPGPGTEAPVVLFLHGNAGNIGERLDTLRLLHDAGAATLIIDYRGYGRSEGRPDEAGTYRDADAAWRWLTRTRGLARGDIVVFGRSLGGPIAARLAARTRPAGLVLESTFTSLPDLAADHYPWMPTRLLTRYRYDTRAYLADVTCPVLVIHGRDDELVPFAHAERLAAVRPPVVELVALDGGHDGAFLVSGPFYRDTLAAFLRRVIATDDGGEARDDVGG